MALLQGDHLGGTTKQLFGATLSAPAPAGASVCVVAVCAGDTVPATAEATVCAAGVVPEAAGAAIGVAAVCADACWNGTEAGDGGGGEG